MEEYLAMILQFRPGIFNSVIRKHNPDFTNLKVDEEKHYLDIHNDRMKWVAVKDIGSNRQKFIVGIFWISS
jgi:hypothetical protein